LISTARDAAVRARLAGVERLGQEPPAPELPPDVVAKTREKYIAAYRQLTEQEPEL